MMKKKETSKNVISKLAEYRKRKKLTQAQLAQLAGVTQSAISMFETGYKTPSLRVALRLSKVLDVSIEDLFGEIIQDNMSSETKYTSPSRQG